MDKNISTILMIVLVALQAIHFAGKLLLIQLHGKNTIMQIKLMMEIKNLIQIMDQKLQVPFILWLIKQQPHLLVLLLILVSSSPIRVAFPSMQNYTIFYVWQLQFCNLPQLFNFQSILQRIQLQAATTQQLLKKLILTPLLITLSWLRL